METKEHKHAGDQIRAEKFGNKYLKGSEKLSPHNSSPLFVTIMEDKDGILVPLDLVLTAGDIVALAGDYYTKGGWAYKLNISPTTGEASKNKDLFANAVEEKEKEAFQEAFSDLASPKVTTAAIDQIYKIEETTYIPFLTRLNALFQQAVYARTVPQYGEKLTNNEAHFAPWSARAYIVGHHSALHMAELAATYQKLANNEITVAAISNEKIRLKISNDLQAIREKPEAYKFAPLPASDTEIFKELQDRYHANAIAQDLFAMHFYSDHFAGGHLNRIGTLRKTMPERFGVWGSILINTMHNEDNARSVTVTNPHQPINPKSADEEVPDTILEMYPLIDEAFGDGTYFTQGNDDNSDMLVNGMTNSLGDIAQVMQGEERPVQQNYGGLCFLPEVDAQKAQAQPLLLIGKDNKTYFRSNLKEINILTPADYEKTLNNPIANGYTELTTVQAFVLVLKLRLLGFYYSPTVKEIPETRSSQPEQSQDSKQEIPVDNDIQPSPDLSAASPVKEETRQPLWRHTKPQDSRTQLQAGKGYSFFHGSSQTPIANEQDYHPKSMP